MRILLLGGTGMLGTEVAGAAPQGAAVRAPSSKELDVTDHGRLRTVLATDRPDWVINCAAWTNVDAAESDADGAARVNAEAPAALGAECARLGIRVLHVSTDYIFDGRGDGPYTEESEPDPINVYGRTKLEGERALTASGARSLIVRTSWVYGFAGRSFPRTMWQRARAGQATSVVDDQYGRPTSAEDLARAMWRLIAVDASGVVHASNGGPGTTWYGVARRVFARAGAERLLRPCTSGEFPVQAARPHNSILDTTRLERLVGGLPRWESSLDRFLDALSDETDQL